MRALLILFAALAAMTPGLAVADTQPPPEAQAGRSIVYLSVIIEPDGAISNATIAKSCGNVMLDWVALDHARKMKVEPSVIEGTPVRSQKVIAVAVTPREPAQRPTPRVTLPRTWEV